MTIFRLPDLGEGLHEAELVAWHVGPGDRVVVDQPLASVETDKAVVEVPSPQAGQIARLHGEPGDLLTVGEPLVEFETKEGADAGTVVGVVLEAPEGQGATAPLPGETPEAKVVRASPAARSLARTLGVGLASIAGTGPGGTVTVEDVETAAPSGKGPAVTPLRGVRRAMAIKMAETHREVVPATVNDLADIGAWPGKADVTLRLVRAIARGCETVPALNAWYLGLDKGRMLHDQIDLGIAMDTEDGLFVPVLRDAGSRPPEDLRRGLEAMKRDVQARSVPLAELRGQTITLSNFGMFGGRFASLVVVSPQVAIIGAGRISDAVVARDGVPAVTRLLPLSLTFDHRAVMGGEAARFLSTAIGDLQSET